MKRQPFIAPELHCTNCGATLKLGGDSCIACDRCPECVSLHGHGLVVRGADSGKECVRLISKTPWA